MNPLGDFIPDGDLLDAFLGWDDSIPVKDDPAREARRLARQWRRLRERMDEVWPDDRSAA